MAVVNSVKLPSNYVTIADLKERWLKNKEKEKQEKEKEKLENVEKKQTPFRQNHQNRIVNGVINSHDPVVKNVHKHENHNVKGWREVGLADKEVKISGSVVEEDGESKKKRKPRVEEGIMDVVSVENGGRKLCKGKCKVVEEVDSVCIEVVGEGNMDRGIKGQRCGVGFRGITGQRYGVGFRGKNNGRRRMGDGVGEVCDKMEGGEQSGKQHNADEEVPVYAKERTNEKLKMGGTFRAYGVKEVEEVATVCTVEVVEENKVHSEITGLRYGVGFVGKNDSWRGVGEVREKMEGGEQSGKQYNAEEEEVLVDVKERTSEKERMGSAYGVKVVEEVATVCTVEVVENKVHSKITGQKCRVGFKGKKNSWRRMDDGVGELSDKIHCGEQSGKQHNADKEEVSVYLKGRTGGTLRKYGGKEVEEVATVCMVEVVEENKVHSKITGQKSRVGLRGNKNSWVGEVRGKMDSGEQSGNQHNAEKGEVVDVVKEKTNEKVKMSGAFCDKEVKELTPVSTLEVVGENKIYREITGHKCRVGFKGKINSWRRMDDGVGEVNNKMDSGEQSGKQHNAEKGEVVDVVKERTNEKVKMRGAFHAYGDKEVEEVTHVNTVEVVGESKVHSALTGKKGRVGFRGKRNSWRRMGDGVGEVNGKMDSGEQSGKQHNAEKGEVVDVVKERSNEKVKMRGAFHAYGDKEVEEGAHVSTVEVVGEKKVYREITGHKCRVGFKGKIKSWRRMDDSVGQVSDKMDSGEQSGKQHNAEEEEEEEEVSVDMKERTNEKVKTRGAFCAYGDKEVKEVATVCTVEVVGEKKVDNEITGQKCRGWFMAKENSYRRMDDEVGQVSDKIDSGEQSGKQHDAEKEEVSVDVKEITDEKVRGRGAFCAYSDKSNDVPSTDSEASLKMKIERDLGDLSLSDRRYAHGRSSVGVYNDRRRYASSRRYEPQKMLKQSFVWVKKEESSNGNAADIETQVDFSSQSTSRTKLGTQ